MKFVYLLLIIFLLENCSVDKRDNSSFIKKINGSAIYIVSIDDINKNKDKDISYLIDSIGFIVLETNENSILSDISEIIFLDDHYFVLDKKNQSILKFSKYGDYVNHIGSKGKGPMEYNFPTDISISNNNILVLDAIGKKINTYSPQGEYLNSVFLNNNYSVIFEPLGDNYLISSNGFSFGLETEPFNFHLINKSGNILQKYIKVKEREYLWHDLNFEFDKYSDRINYSKSEYNTVYSIDKDSVFRYFEIDFLDKTIPDDYFTINSQTKTNMESRNASQQHLFKRIREDKLCYGPIKFLESDRIIYFDYFDNNDRTFSFFDKQTQNIFTYPFKNFKNSFFMNISRPINKNGNIFYGVLWPVNAHQLIASFAPDIDSNKALYDALMESKELMELIVKVDATDNPIIVKYYLKK